MRIQSLQLKNFKRFTDVTLQGIPASAKLVLLIGSNGSGKSSVFDAFELISDLNHRSATAENKSFTFSGGKQYSYHHKNKGLLQINISFQGSEFITCSFNNPNSGLLSASTQFETNTFYGRSAVRYLPRITRNTIGQAIDIAQDVDKPLYFIDEDKRFENDIDLLIKEVVEKIFIGINTNSTKQLEDVKIFLNKINDAFPRIFGTSNGTKLSFKSFIPPAEGNPSRLIFEKGDSEINYDLLSAGEKEIVNLLFNLFVRNKYFNDTIYFLDEIDAHLNTKLQYSLLKEITENWIPKNCQLWTASHSIGFIQYAKDSEDAVIFDFDDYDFDYPRILSPEPKDNPNIYEIAVSKEILTELFKNYKIFFVENKDRLVYSELNIANTLFVQENGKTGVYHKTKNGEFSGLVDRDFLSDDDIDQIEKQYATLKVLRYYSVENYLFHPDNLSEYYNKTQTPFNINAYIEKLLVEKTKVTAELIRKLALVRVSYPFFKEPEFQNTNNQKRFANSTENFEEVAKIEKDLKSHTASGEAKSFKN
jgi:AAA15 family ATPase/GTPase